MSDKLNNEELLVLAQVDVVKQLQEEIELAYATGADHINHWKSLYRTIVEALGYTWADIECGRVCHADIVKYARVSEGD